MKPSLANIGTIARKELRGYFGSAVAVIFLALFLANTLYAFFWIDKFFARGLTDLRPMFDRMPLLMILLVAALSMRLWSEEKKVGTLEILMTLPVPRWQLVAGKFAAGMALMALALLLTFGLPLTVSRMGDLDWGPVIGGYLAALLLAAAYLAIGMCVSAATDNQIVALSGTILACVVAYLPGTATIADTATGSLGDALRAIGTGSRFESVARGVLDLRDLVYYGGIVIVFLGLNVWLLGRQSWGRGPRVRARHRATSLAVALIAANVVLLNLWLSPVARARIDLTQHGEYSLSGTTKHLLGGLDGPLLIRGYFSAKTHPKLAPLIPKIKDLLEEYRVAGGGRVKVEIVDPGDNDEAIKEAKEKYEISPAPLRFASRLEKSVINAYFTVLVEYGDQHETLGLDQLIEVKVLDIGELEIKLKNFEYEVTRTIKKVMTGFQSVDAMFASLPGKLELTAYVTPDTLPADLKGQVDGPPGTGKHGVDAIKELDDAVAELDKSSGGKLVFKKVAPSSEAEMNDLFQKYGLRPFADLATQQVYYFALLLRVGDRLLPLALPNELAAGQIKTLLTGGIKRIAPGFTKVIGMWVPPAPPPQQPMMEGMQPQRMPPPQQFDELRRALEDSYEVRDVDLASRVPDEVEVLVLAGPADLDPKAVEAVDQFVMRGGGLVVLAGHYRMTPSNGWIGLEKVTTGLEGMFSKWGITVGDEVVLDTANDTFLLPNGGDPQAGTFDKGPYPYFLRIDKDRTASSSVITSGLPGVVLHWASAVNADAKLGSEKRKVETLLRSTSNAWRSSSTDVQPDSHGTFPRPPDAKTGQQVVAVAVTGGFPSSVAEDKAGAGSGSAAGSGAGSGEGGRKLVHSPPDARVVVFGSSAFVSDDILQFSQQLGSDLALSNVQLVQNAVDWTIADTDLLAIRARSSASRALTVPEYKKFWWEAMNYGIALAGLFIVIGVSWLRRRRVEPIDLPAAEVAS